MTVEAAATQTFSHTGKFSNVFGLALKNALLTIVTLTLYRFWARTAMRRRLWSRAWIMGDPLEYTGTGWELFRGFLIALPCFFLPAIFVFYIAPLAMDPCRRGVAHVWVLHRRRAADRGGALSGCAAISFRARAGAASAWGLPARPGAFAVASWGWWVLQMLSLGWYTPAARMNRAKLLWENARFGDQPFEFIDDGQAASEGPLVAVRARLVRLLGRVHHQPPSVGGVGCRRPAVLSGISQGVETRRDADRALRSSLRPSFRLVALFFMLLALFWAPYNAAAMNRIASLISLDGARFKLKAKTFSLFCVTLAGWIIIIFSLGLLAPLAGLLQVRYVLNRLEIIGTPRFAEIGQSIVAAPEAGESLGDAFDLDMGVGMI